MSNRLLFSVISFTLLLHASLVMAIQPVATRINPVDGAEMVLVPAGEFMMGLSAEQLDTWRQQYPYHLKDDFSDEMPRHPVYLDAYWIYKYEVTVGQYKQFCRETGHALPKTMVGLTDRYPIENVTWEDARAYAEWVQAALPTEAEWEKAARGTDGRLLPWGNDWDPAKCRCQTRDETRITSPVGSYPADTSPYGAMDMAGNLREWCADWYAPDYYLQDYFSNRIPYNPAGPAKQVAGRYGRVLRGGNSRIVNGAEFRTTNRAQCDPNRWSPPEWNGWIAWFGFRCVVRAPMPGHDTLIQPPVELPPTVGKPRTEVRRALEALRLRVTETLDTRPEQPDDVVLTCKPVAGAKVELGSTVTLTINCVPPADAPPITRVNSIDGTRMLWIPPGPFLMGLSDKQAEGWLARNPRAGKSLFDPERPQRTVYLDGFWIYQNLVTVGQYRWFCEAMGLRMPDPPKWGWRDEDPMGNITYGDALSYARWMGGTLPTEAQWEKAARGGDGRLYPWGETWDPAKCQGSTKTFYDAGKPAPAGNHPQGASPYGVMDMAGNVMQLCLDWYAPDSYRYSGARDPQGPVTGQMGVMRGASWTLFEPMDFRATRRMPIVRDFGPTRNADISAWGFRVVVNSVQPPPPPGPAILPPFTEPLEGENELRVTNEGDCAVKLGVRSGTRGVDADIPPHTTVRLSVPAGICLPYIIYENKPYFLFPCTYLAIEKGFIEIMNVANQLDGSCTYGRRPDPMNPR